MRVLSNFPRLGLLYSGLAKLIVLIHRASLAFALMGGMLVSRWPSLAWIHVPSVAWIALNQCLGWNCPLTLGRAVVEAAGADGRIRRRLRLPPSGSLTRIGRSPSRACGWTGDHPPEWSSLFVERWKKQTGEGLRALLLQRLRTVAVADAIG